MKITPEIKEQINILYLRLGTKAAVAREIGCSPSTVSKYIVSNFKLNEDKELPKFEGQIGNSNKLAAALKNSDNPSRQLCELCMLSDSEWQELKEMQKEIFI